MLLAAHHQDRESAALSLTANRVSKIDKLLESARESTGPIEQDGCFKAAQRNADSLVYDVLEYIADGGAEPRHAQELAHMATMAATRADTRSSR